MSAKQPHVTFCEFFDDLEYIFLSKTMLLHDERRKVCCFIIIDHMCISEYIFCGKLLWQSQLLSRVKIFMWLALKGRCLMADNLQKIGGLIRRIAPYATWHFEMTPNLLFNVLSQTGFGDCSGAK
uniref:Reverse transcriptase zinc-binding domain-containing protein n=1 Tax=Oryza glumipatula TaxID=40148 RepID=A0A0D9YSW9_9ORYZ